MIPVVGIVSCLFFNLTMTQSCFDLLLSVAMQKAAAATSGWPTGPLYLAATYFQLSG